MGHAYRLKSTGASSDKYGLCEICNKHCSEVFGQTEVKGFIFESKVEKYAEGGRIYGHLDCLKSKQKA